MKVDFDSLNPHDCHEFLVSMIAPRPIAWVSTVGADGTFNLAPFSFFGGVCAKPPTLFLSISRRRGEKKDTVRNIEYTRDFVVNVVDDPMASKMNVTAKDYPPEISEFKEAGLTPLAGDKVKSPRLAEAPINMECKVVQIIEIGTSPAINTLIIGEIVRAHVRDDLMKGGAINVSPLKLVGRMGADNYCLVDHVFEMKRLRYP